MTSNSSSSQPQQQFSNPFASAQTNTSNTQQSSLFGSNAQAQTGAAQTSGLFGNLNASQAQSSQAAAPSLFGNATAGAGQQQSTSSTAGNTLFNRAATPSQPASSSGPTGLFGNPSTSTQQSQSTLQVPQAPALGTPALGSTSLFGGQQGGQTQAQTSANSGMSLGGSTLFGGSSLFGGQTQNQGLPQQQASNQDGQQGQGSLAASSRNAHFHTLLERGKRRRDVSGQTRLGDVPEIQLGLSDISSKLRRIGGADGISRKDDAAGRSLLAASGAPMRTTLRDLDAFSATVGAAPFPAQVDPTDADIDGYVNGLRARATADLFRDSVEEANRDFDRFLQDNMNINWDDQKRRIYEHLGLKKPAGHTEDGVNGSPSVRGAFGRSTRRAGSGLGADRSRGPGSFAASGSRSVLGGSISRTNANTSLFSDVPEKASSPAMPSALEDPWLRSKQEKYSASVKDLNSSRLQDVVYPVVERFARVEEEAGGDTPVHLISAYRAIKEITKENPNVYRPSDPGAVRERQYAHDYLDDAPNSIRSMAIRKQILDGSRKYLEDSFYEQLEDTISKNPREANMGGIPTKLNKVRAYVRLRNARKSLGTEIDNLQVHGEDFVWVLLYFLLRCGLVEEAAKYVSDNERAIRTLDRHFATYMAAYARDPDRRLPRDMQQQVNAIYQQRTRIAPDNSIDPYRMACYKIVGRCDLSRRNIDGIQVGLEDWVWILFSLAREVNRAEETASEVFGLDELRAMVEEVGQRHFVGNPENAMNYATYFYLLVLAGMFEQSIHWLYPHNYITAVHFAIALDFYGLLRVSSLEVAESELLTHNTRGKQQISFARLLGYYTRDFRLARAEAATDYLSLICLNKDLPGSAGDAQAAVCHEALKELVLETREFAQLLGDMRADGRRVPGVIEQRLGLINLTDQTDFMRSLTMQAAGVAEDSGRTTDAVLLYHLAEDYDKVVIILNHALADSIAVEIGREPMRLQPLKPRAQTSDLQMGQQSNGNQQQQEAGLSLTAVDDPIALAKHMVGLYNANALYYGKIQEANRQSAAVLLRMCEAKTKVAAGRWPDALDVIVATNLLPTDANGDVTKIRAKANTINGLQHVVSRNVGNLLMWTIQCCAQQRKVLKSSAFDTQNRALVEDLSRMARDMMTFAGLLKYRLPGDVYDVLARAGQDVGSP